MTNFTEQLKGRFAVLGLIVLIVLGALTIRLWSMQLVSGHTFAKAAEENRVRTITLPASRGRILDAKGRPLVTNRPVWIVSAKPVISTDTTMIASLSGVIDVPAPEIQKRLSSTLAQRLAPRVLRVDVPFSTVAYLQEHKTDFPDVTAELSSVREFPKGSLAAHVLGYTGQVSEAQMDSGEFKEAKLGDVVGKSGVEAYYDSVLQGEKGFLRYEVDNQGRTRRTIESAAARSGKDVELTIDADVQAVTEKALAEALVEAHSQDFPHARAGAAVVLDVNTGAVVAMASAPTYDPRTFLNGITEDAWARLTAKTSEYPLNNRAIMAAYPPASTFKSVTAAAAMNAKLAGPHSYFQCTGTWEGLGHQWSKHCWKRSGHGGLDLTEGIVDSCDAVFYEVGKRFYETKGEKLQAYARRVGLGADTGIDLPGEVSGRVPDAEWKRDYNKDNPEYQKWLGGDTVNMAIGQGDMLVTPLQLANVYATLANGGKVMKPHVLKTVLGSDGKPSLVTSSSVISTAPSSPGELAALRSALVGVTEYGTGASAFSGFPYPVAGKTGTAQVRGKDDYAVFACYAFKGKQGYAIAVMIEQGGHGGSVAAPAARQILSKLFNVRYRPVHSRDESR